ncbi:schwannomin-interacting protein 1 [Alosa pseudoharengus]|uniref:schwannomin-interacting protein 1 n=1 Tax=Alosa sapidissima TaxID=34773 RepID=UPI001C087BE5|nr:schwannomin-interacting protein 1 [Alosa sapidissima]
MEGTKEQERERGEEKESDETEEDTEGAAPVWEKDYTEDDLGLPIMHWEALSLRIAELEKQEEERREKEGIAKLPDWTKGQDLGIHRDTWEDGEDLNSRVTALTSRGHMNLQLCFINDSESEEEEEEQTTKRAGKRTAQPASSNASINKSKPTGFKMEVRAALNALRDKLWTEQKRESSSHKILKKPLDRSELQKLSLRELMALRTSLSKDIQDLSSELVGRLLTRDQLRTEQDAMLLEVQDMTAL